MPRDRTPVSRHRVQGPQQVPHVQARRARTHGRRGADTEAHERANRLSLAEGAAGARSHFHALWTELFHVLDGVMRFTLDGVTTTVAAGGLVSVPPRTPHSFGSVPGSAAELLVVLAPGVDRFGCFRSLGRIRHGLESFDDLLAEQDRYDVHFL
ncbi:cupin domain-containing protein [Streptomyces tanashiensis]|uniref:cupin domain-containing protein n=1 Tax=Streptomyces tanashiensis TaxID=67367 RepID=UPI00340D84B0